MYITAKIVYRETINFLCNQFVNILLIAFSCALINTTLNHIFLPDKSQIANLAKDIYLASNSKTFTMMHDIIIEKQHVLIQFITISMLSSVINNTLLSGEVLILGKLVSSRCRINILHIFIASLEILPKLFFLVLLTTILVQIGTILLVIPGILIGITLTLAPIFIVQRKTNIFTAIYNSTIFFYKNTRLVYPAIVIYLLMKVALLLLIAPSLMLLVPNLFTLIVNTLSNLISSSLLIYLFRLHMLMHC